MCEQEYDLVCPCCSWEHEGEFTDGTDPSCGCAAWISVCSEAGVYIVLKDEPCPETAQCNDAISSSRNTSIMVINSRFISTDPEIKCGTPCIRGRRLTVSGLLHFLTRPDATLEDYALQYEVPVETLTGVLQDLATCISKNRSTTTNG